MRWSKAFIPTLREEPSGVEAESHKLLLRGGFIRQLMSGVYIYLPLGWRVLKKIEKIIREEMDNIGAQELFLSVLTPAELWKETGRWEDFGEEMFRLKDRKGREIGLAPTHEEIMTELARRHIRSWRDLPQIWYQIQTKFRDEPRPRGGILRVREFLMKDSYSFDATWEGLDKSYELHKQAYIKIFERCGLKFEVVSASGGLMGKGQSEEFMVLSEAGEDELLICENCGYKANVEVAEGESSLKEVECAFKDKKKVYTPNVKTVEEVASFIGCKPHHIIKSLVYVKGDGKKILVLIRGDDEVNEAKLRSLYGFDIRMAYPDEVYEWFNVSVGFIGPLGLEVDEVIADENIRYMGCGVVGAGEDDYHIVGVIPEKDFKIDRYENIRKAKTGDICPKCKKGKLKSFKAIEIGHIFKLGTKYSESMGLYYQDKDGKSKVVIMGSYGIGLGRIMASAVELYHDKDGIIWPLSIAPYHVDIIEIAPEFREVAERVYKDLKESGIEVIYDDRNETPGVKFKDADLIGFPLKVVVGRKVKEDKAEIQIRKTNEKIDTKIEDIRDKIKEMLSAVNF